ncbi:MAG: FAD-binding oxidoreductase [Gammaproteobacteria bacterium]
MSDILEKLESVVAAGGILTGDDVSGRNAGIWHEEGIQARAIVRPRSTDEVSSIMRICHDNNQVVVAHGGRTGLVESHITCKDDIVLSLELMNTIEEIDEAGRTMTVQAGTLLQSIQDEVKKVGLDFPLDLGARGSCTIGGNASTNAGGNRVIRYGMTRDNILGLEAVLADGTVLTSLNRMIKNNAGYDLKHLFIGTEGTLGIVTRLVLRLREAAKSQDTALMAIDEFPKVIDFLKFVDRELGGTLSAFEVMWRDFYLVVTTQPAKSKPPLEQDYPYYVLVESLGADQENDSRRFQSVLMEALERGLLADVVIAKSQAERNAMWAIRDDVEQAHKHVPIFIFDVSLQIKYMNDYVERVKQALDKEWPGNRCFIFGHLGDGNLHYLITVGDGSAQTRRKVEACVYRPLQEINGSISAEHGIGLEKKAYLAVSRSENEIALMRRLKHTLDPKGILNPGKVFDLTI